MKNKTIKCPYCKTLNSIECSQRIEFVRYSSLSFDKNGQLQYKTIEENDDGLSDEEEFYCSECKEPVDFDYEKQKFGKL